jgi:hypothetical protein
VDIADRVVVILGGSGLVGSAIARRLIPMRPARIVIGGLWEEEAREAVDALRNVPGVDEIEMIPEWGDIFVRREHRELSRREILDSDELRRGAPEGARGRHLRRAERGGVRELDPLLPASAPPSPHRHRLHQYGYGDRLPVALPVGSAPARGRVGKEGVLADTCSCCWKGRGGRRLGST